MPKMNLPQKLNAWHQTKTGLLIFTIIEIGLLYLFASLAIDSGSLLDYVISFLLLVVIIQNAVLFIRMLIKGHHE